MRMPDLDFSNVDYGGGAEPGPEIVTGPLSPQLQAHVEALEAVAAAMAEAMAEAKSTTMMRRDEAETSQNHELAAEMQKILDALEDRNIKPYLQAAEAFGYPKPAREWAKVGEWIACCKCGHVCCGTHFSYGYRFFGQSGEIIRKCGDEYGGRWKACCKCKNYITTGGKKKW